MALQSDYDDDVDVNCIDDDDKNYVDDAETLTARNDIRWHHKADPGDHHEQTWTKKAIMNK